MLSQLSYPPVSENLRGCVGGVNRGGGHCARNCARELPGSVLQVARADDVVAAEHSSCLVAGDLRGHPLRHTLVSGDSWPARTYANRFATGILGRELGL